MTAKDLKNALLQEAVQGKLVPQIASEGNARDLLEEIRKSHTDLQIPTESAGKKKGDLRSKSQIRVTKKEKPLPEITDDEVPFDIPESWCWCRLGEITSLITDGKHGGGVLQDNSGYYFLSAKDIQNGELIYTRAEQITKEDFENTHKRTNLEPGDICIVNTGGTIGKLAIAPNDEKTYKTTFQKSVAIIKPINTIVDNHYISYYLQFDLKNLVKISGGSAIHNLLLSDMKNEVFPLPPLAEQKRIVATIEKFMPLIEEYGKKETVLNELNAQIGTLTKKAILQEAVQGKLVPQIPAEGNAKDLLEQIKAQKAAFIKEGKNKKEKPLPEITEDEIPFDIPESWCWCKVGDLFSTMSGLSYKKDVLEENTNHMIRVLRGGNILDTSYVFKDDDIMISSEYVKPELFLKKNYLITPAVTSLEHIGKMGYVEKDYDDTVVGGFVLMLIPYLSDKTISKYCLYLFGTHWFRTMCKEITHKSGQAFYNLSRDKLLQLEIPLPPLSEQKRIVEAIEQLLPLCEKLGK